MVNQKRATWTGVALWIISLVIGVIIVMLTGAIDPRDPSTNLLGFISLIVLTLLASIYYFAGKRGIKKNAKEGLAVGITFIIVAAILDLIALVITIALGKVTLAAVAPYYLSSQFVASVALTILIPVLIGYYKKG